MKKRLIPLLAVVILVVLAWGGYRWASEWRFVESTDDAYVEGDITNLSPKISGHIVDVAVKDNQSVKSGDLLLRIDDRDFKAKVAEIQAMVAAREAALAQLEDRIAVQKAGVNLAAAGISGAQADLRRSQADLARAQRLVKEDFVSRQRFDSQNAETAKAEASLRGNNAQLEGARHQIAVLESERSVVKAQLDQALAQLDQARSDLDATIIRAPTDGVIGNRSAREGMFVRPGTHLLSVVPLATVWVDANFKETQIGRMKAGDRAWIETDAYPGVVIEGIVSGFSPASGAKFSLLPPENATGNFTKVVQRIPVRIVLPPDNPLAGRLRPGLSVLARIDTRLPAADRQAATTRPAP